MDLRDQGRWITQGWGGGALLEDGSRGSLWEYFHSCESPSKHLHGAGSGGGEKPRVLQYDVPTAFLNSPVDETIFLKMVPGCEETDKDGVQHVMRLCKSVYRIPQVPVNWHSTIDDFVVAIGCKPLKFDP